MSGYENFLLRMNACGNTLREEHIENSKMLLNMTFTDDPSYIPEGVKVWYSDRIIHPRIYDYKWKSTTPFQATIQTLINEPFYLGDVVPWGKENGYWMVVGVNNLHGINWEGVLQYCNYRIKFISPLNGEIREYPISMINATQYGTGEEYKNLISIGSAAHIVYLSCDEHTVLLNNGFRFLLDKNTQKPTAYKLTQVDSTSFANDKGGYLRLSVLEEQFNPKTDNAEKMIADFYEDIVGNNTEVIIDETKWL